MVGLTPLKNIDEELVEFNRARIKEEVSNSIYDLMVRYGVKRTELADLMDTFKSRISLMLSGDQNFQIETLADVFLVLGRAVHITLGADATELRLPVDEVEPINRAFDPEEWEREHEYKEDEINGEEEEEDDDERIKAGIWLFKAQTSDIEKVKEGQSKQDSSQRDPLYIPNGIITAVGGQYEGGTRQGSETGANLVFSGDSRGAL